MSGDYFDRLNFAFEILQVRNENPSVRLTFLAILYKWNSCRRVNSFALSDRELQNLTGLGSNATTCAKRKLKNLRLIDFKATKSTTYYRLYDTSFGKMEVRREVAGGTQDGAQSGRPPNISTTSENNHKEESKSVRLREGEGVENIEFEI